MGDGPSKNKGGSKFDPEGKDYDYKTARQWGMGPDGKGDNKGHWGSVAPASEAQKKKHGLAPESYLLLKGRSHPTWHKALAAENARGFFIKKFDDRFFSIPKADKSRSKRKTLLK